MASEKISQLTPHTPNSSDVIPVELGGTNFSDTVGGIETAAAALVVNITGTAAGLSGTPALPSGTTATTQAANDNSTKVATTAYVATAAGAYLPLAGGTMTGAIQMTSGLAINWNADSGISRLAANNIGFGNGTPGDYSGTIQCGYATVHVNLSVIGNTFYYSSINMQATGTATSGQNYGSVAITAGGTFYNSGVAYDYWNFQTLMGTGTAPTSTLYFSHSGSTGQTYFQIPSATVFEWSTDAGISRLGAASLAIGNGTAGDTTGQITATTFTVAASGAAPTSAGTAGTVGQIITHGGFMYFCSVTGAAGAATWNKLTMSAV
jgi:hypothetical protein